MQKGFSLLELITVLLIVGIFMSIATANFDHFFMRQERELALHRIQSAIYYAQQEAASRGKTVTVCGSHDHKKCVTDNWTNGFMVVIQQEQTNNPSKESLEILQVFQGLKYGQLYFDHFGKHLNIQPDGMTINLGTFTYCPRNRDRREADALIINRVCRTYRPIERNSLGVLVKNEGTTTATPLSCR
jgi:prepilin-type N-terminal cleavage/methylation domain-containing protein